MPAPQGSQSRELPVYFRLSVVAPAAASLTIVVLVIAGACLFVSHERRKYQNVASECAGFYCTKLAEGQPVNGAVICFDDIESTFLILNLYWLMSL